MPEAHLTLENRTSGFLLRAAMILVDGPDW
jgi:hypothetical protein